MADEHEQFAAIESDLRWITKTLEKIERNIDKQPADAALLYVTKAEFEAKLAPLQRVVYGLVTLILSAVVMAAISQVLISK